MQRELKSAVMQRLKFAAAELEVVGDVLQQDGDCTLIEHVQQLKTRITRCISGVASGKERLHPNS